MEEGGVYPPSVGRSLGHGQASRGRALGKVQRKGALASFLSNGGPFVGHRQPSGPGPDQTKRSSFAAWYNTIPVPSSRPLPTLSPLPPSPTMSHHIHQSALSQTGRSSQDDEEAELGDPMMGHESDDSPTPSISQPGHSGRKGSKKVRTGCITCK